MADFNTAVIWLKQGRKIRRPDWSKNSYLRGIDPISFKDESPATLSVKQIEADDWEAIKKPRIVKNFVLKAMEGISVGFRWSKTKQGGTYWREVLSNLEDLLEDEDEFK